MAGDESTGNYKEIKFHPFELPKTCEHERTYQTTCEDEIYRASICEFVSCKYPLKKCKVKSVENKINPSWCKFDGSR